MMRVLGRLLAFVLSLMVIAVFYVFAVMMENEETKRSDEFVVEAAASPLTAQAPLESQDARQLAEAFGLAFPLPEGFAAGRVSDSTWHAYATRQLILQGALASVTGIRPVSAAAAILPRGAAFTASPHALLGYPLLEAQYKGRMLYALITADAAFLLSPNEGSGLGGFSLMEPLL